MNNNLILDSSYKKAIELAGVKATINNIDTKILIKEANAEYGIDYKKIISSTSFNQGDCVLVNGVQYLIVDTEEQLSQSIYNIGIFRKTLPILFGSTYKPVQAIVDKVKGMYVDGSLIEEVHDQYKFIIPKLGNKTSVDQQIIYDGGVYKTISVDSTRDGIYVNIAKYESEYDPHTYEISLSETTKTIVEGGTYQISGVTCTDNGTTVTPTPILTYSSSDITIASVSDSGLVTGIKAGTCNINVVYNGVSAILSITVNVKPVEKVISYSTTSSNGYSFAKMVGATLSYVKTIDGVIDTTLDISFSLDAVGQQLLNSAAISLVKKTASTLYIRNLTVTTTKSFVLTVTDNANGAIVATQTLSTKPL